MENHTHLHAPMQHGKDWCWNPEPNTLFYNLLVEKVDEMSFCFFDTRRVRFPFWLPDQPPKLPGVEFKSWQK